MNINRNTYEIFIIDYLEGNLNPVQVSELLLFLEQNPDLKQELENLELVYLTQNEITPIDKTHLKKPEFNLIKKSFEHLLIANIEGDNTPDESSELIKAKHLYPELVQEERLFFLTKLVPDLSVHFTNKKALKHFVLATYYPLLIRIAAVFLLFSTIAFYFSQRNASVKQFAIKQQSNNSVLPHAPEVNKQKVIQPAIVKQLVAQSHQKKNTSPAIIKTSVIKEKASSIIIPMEQPVALNVTMISSAHAMLPAYVMPPQITNNNIIPLQKSEFISLQTLIKNKMAKTFKQDKIVAEINRNIGVDLVIEKDTASGKIKRFEIAGIGIERSH
jgi:hypothetical protein